MNKSIFVFLVVFLFNQGVALANQNCSYLFDSTSYANDLEYSDNGEAPYYFDDYGHAVYYREGDGSRRYYERDYETAPFLEDQSSEDPMNYDGEF